MAPLELLVAGAGSRGSTYAGWAARHPEHARVVAVAEPRDAYRDALGDAHGIPPERRFRDWREAAAAGRLADAAIVATQDREHVEPAVAFAELGYALLLEKPMAPTEEECRQIAEAVERAGVMFAVCHVLRYTPYTRLLKGLLDDGRGRRDRQPSQHLEPVGWWHQAHSFVRGNWRREDEPAPMLLAKCCHDIDWLLHLVGRPARGCRSFGCADALPARAARRRARRDRCLDCAVEPDVPVLGEAALPGHGRARRAPSWPRPSSPWPPTAGT